LARLYLYKGDKVQALKYAKEVIDSKQFNFIGRLQINNDPESAASDMTFTPEHIFSVYTKGLKIFSDQLFKSSGMVTGEEQDLFTTLPKLNAIFEVTNVGYASDLRGPNAATPLWDKENAAAIYSRKYLVAANVVSVRQSRVPVLRLSEMYYIAAEAEPDNQLALGYLNAVRTARLLPVINPATPAEFQNELFKEYRKDFFGEGQLWFYYKRKNTAQIPNSPDAAAMTEAKYVFPLPTAEIEFGK
jgi:hypothetical protein